MSIKKSIQKLLSEPNEMRMNEVHGILIYFGYELDRIKGSHHHFVQRGKNVITIPVHNKKVKEIYLKQIKKVIIESFPLSLLFYE